MPRLGERDLPDRLAPTVPAWATQIGFGLLCAGGFTMLRAVTDSIVGSAGPFALGYPAVLIATLFGRWSAGCIAGVTTVVYSWYFLLPFANSFELATALDGPRVGVNAVAYALTIACAELFRRAVRRATAERDRQIAERDLFLEEFEHRVKNNFMLVASLLDLQRRRAGEPATQEALGAALARVESIARAHRHLYRGGSHAAVDMGDYLHELCTALSEALFLRTTVTLACDAQHVAMPRDRAVPIGLIVNELVTNAAKHAFKGREAGRIRVAFGAAAGGWELVVSDDGVGMPEETLANGREGGLGARLVDAFARQADGVLSAATGPQGTRYTLTLAR